MLSIKDTEILIKAFEKSAIRTEKYAEALTRESQRLQRMIEKVKKRTRSETEEEEDSSSSENSVEKEMIPISPKKKRSRSKKKLDPSKCSGIYWEEESQPCDQTEIGELKLTKNRGGPIGKKSGFLCSQCLTKWNAYRKARRNRKRKEKKEQEN